MRVAIDCRTVLSRKTGDRTYCLNLLRGLAQLDLDATQWHFDLLLDAPDTNHVLPDANVFHPAVIEARNSRAWTLLALPRWVKKACPDLVHVQYLAPWRLPCPYITTIHDVVWRVYPRTFPRLHRTIMNAFMPRVARRAASVICGTQSAKRDIEKYLGVDTAKIKVTPYSIEPKFFETVAPSLLDFVREKYNLRVPYILSVGVQQPRKNVARLIEAFAQFNKRFPNSKHTLVICGKEGWGEVLPSSADLIFTGYVEDEELAALYTMADLFVYPSLYEGFGLPILEAMACGCAVLTSNRGAMQEVAGDAAQTVDPTSLNSIEHGLEEVLCNPARRDELRHKGCEHAAQWTLKGQALATLECYRAEI